MLSGTALTTNETGITKAGGYGIPFFSSSVLGFGMRGSSSAMISSCLCLCKPSDSSIFRSSSAGVNSLSGSGKSGKSTLSEPTELGGEGARMTGGA